MPLRPLAGRATAVLLLSALPAGLTPLDRGALAALTEARALSVREGSRIWPGFALQRQELLAYDGDRRQILVGAMGRPAHFVPVPGAGPGIMSHTGALPQITRAPSPAVWLAGWPAVALPYSFVETDEQPRPQEVFAPAFGAWEQWHFPAAAAYDRLAGHPYPTGDLAQEAAAELEDRLLADALRAGFPADWRTFAREFLAVRADRRRHLEPAVSRFEDLAEVITGLPYYVADAYTDRAAVDPTFLASVRDPASWQSWPRSEFGVAGALDLPLDANGLRGDRYQLTGLAEARLLDRLAGPSWRTAVGQGAALDSLLARAVTMPRQDAAKLLRAGRRAGGWMDLWLAIRDPGRGLPEAYRSWLRTPGRKVTCWLSPVGGHVQVRSGSHPIELDARTLFAFELAAFKYDRKGCSLDAKGVPMLWHAADSEWPYERVTFFLPPEADVTLDGRLLALHDGSLAITRQLAIRARGIRLEVPAGRIIARGRDLDVRPR